MFMLTFAGPARAIDDSYLKVSKAFRERGLRLVAQYHSPHASLGRITFRIVPSDGHGTKNQPKTAEEVQELVRKLINSRHCEVFVNPIPKNNL